MSEATASAIAAGLLIGLAVAIKVTPIIFVAYFLWRRRFGLALAALAAIALWSLVLFVIGYSAAAKISRKAAAGVIVTLWAVYVLAKSAVAGIF